MASLLLPLLPGEELSTAQTMHIQLSLQGEQGSFVHLYTCPTAEQVYRPLHDCNFPRQRKAIHSELWKDIQGFLLILNKC